MSNSSAKVFASPLRMGSSRLFQQHPSNYEHISTNLSKPVFVAFGQTEIWAFLAFGLFHLSLPRKVHQIPWGRQFGGPFSMLESWFFRLFRGFLCIFRDETLFSKVFPMLSAFSIRQNMFPSQKSGKGNGNLY